MPISVESQRARLGQPGQQEDTKGPVVVVAWTTSHAGVSQIAVSSMQAQQERTTVHA